MGAAFDFSLSTGGSKQFMVMVAWPPLAPDFVKKSRFFEGVYKKITKKIVHFFENLKKFCAIFLKIQNKFAVILRQPKRYL